MPDINVSPNPNSAPNLQDFTTAAGRAGGGGQAVSVEGGKVGEMGRFARVFSRAESNRAAMRSFRDALREEFGGGAANTAVRELLNRDYAAGKPLTARHIVQATARARQEAETTALPEFIAGRGFASGREITLGDGRHPYTLDGALDAFLESRDIQVNEADRRFLKERIVSALSRPGANQGAASRKELFQRVRGGKIGDLDPLTRAQPSGAMQDKARLIDLLGKGQEYAVASRFIGEMRALQPEGALTGATVLRACFHEEAPAEEAGDLRQQVQERVARYSSPEAVGRELADAGIPADILERIPEKTMQGLASRVEARIAAAADDAPLTPERAAQVRKEALGKFAASCLAAGELAQTHPTDAESLMRLVLTNAAPPSPALLAALPGMADRVPPDTLHALASGDTDRAADALDSLRRCMTSDILPSMRDVDNLPEMGGEDIAKGGGQIMALLAGRMTREDAGALASGFAAAGPAAKTMEAMSRYLLLRSERDLAFNPMTVIDTLRGASLALADRGGIPRSEISSPSVFGKVEPHDLPPSLRVRLEIDLLPEPRDPASPREGEFTPAQKALMKEAIYRRNVQDANVLTTLLRAADSRLEIVRRLASPGIAPDQLAAGVRDLFARYQEEQGRPGAPALPADGMEIMLDLAVGLAGFDDAQIGTLAAHLQRDESVVSASRRYASPEAVRQELADAGIPADILERMPETTLRDLTARVGTRIANAASSSDAPLTPERAAGIRREALGDFIASCEAARELAQTHPADAESLMRLALANARPPSPALLAALPGLADRLPSGALQALASGDPGRTAEALDSLEQPLDAIAQVIFEINNARSVGGDEIAASIDQIMTLAAGRLPRDGIAALASPGAHETVDAVYRYLSLRSMQNLDFNMMNAMQTLSSALPALADRAGIPRSAVPGPPGPMGELDPRQLPPSLRVRLAIDALPEPRDPGAPTAREFTPAHKAFMKAAAQRYNVQDANVLTSLLGVAKNQLGDMAKLASLNTTPNLLAESLRGLLGTYQLEQRRPDAPALPANGMEIMLDLAVSLAGFDAAQIRNFAANMRGEDAAVVAGAVLNGAEGGLPGLPPEGRRNFRAAYDMMKALYTVSGIRENGQAGQADRHFSDIVPLHRVPGGSNGCMSILAQMAGPGISRGALALSYILPPFSQAEWNALLPITAKAGQGPNADLAAELLALAGQDLLAALAANGGRTLSNAQIWEAVTGGPMPAGVRDANFGERLSAAFFDGYMGSLRGIAPQIDDYRRDINARALIMTGGIRPRRLLELTRPGATLTLADIRGDMHMSSLNNYDAKTAYGLRTDFLRTPSALPMSFTDAQGNNHVTHRPAGGGHSNDTLEPQFQEIIGWVNGMTGNREIQTARVLQAFSQAPQITVSMYSNVFGLPLDINGNFSISATARADGRVLVEITHDPARGLEPAARTVPIFARMEFSINPDGSHDCTGLEMRRTDI